MKELDFSTLATKLTFWSIFLFRTSQARINWGNKIEDSIHLWILSIMSRSRNPQCHKETRSEEHTSELGLTPALPKPIPRYVLNECLNVWFKWQEEEFGVIPHVKYCRRKWVTNLNFVPHFKNYFSTTSFPIVQKKSSSGTKRIFLFVESVQISPSSFVCEREESWC